MSLKMLWFLLVTSLSGQLNHWVKNHHINLLSHFCLKKRQLPLVICYIAMVQMVHLQMIFPATSMFNGFSMAMLVITRWYTPLSHHNTLVGVVPSLCSFSGHYSEAKPRMRKNPPGDVAWLKTRARIFQALYVICISGNQYKWKYHL